MGKCFGLPQTETRQFASFLALAGLCRLRRDFLNNSKALASVGRLPGCPDLHHPGFLYRYKNPSNWRDERATQPDQTKEGVEIQLVGSVGMAFSCSAGMVASLLSESPHLRIRGGSLTRTAGRLSLGRFATVPHPDTVWERVFAPPKKTGPYRCIYQEYHWLGETCKGQKTHLRCVCESHLRET